MNKICLVGMLALALSANAGEAFRFYRFKVDRTQGGAVQINDVKFFQGAREITKAFTKVAWDTTTKAPNGFVVRPTYEPTAALDGDPKTKWYDDRARNAKTVGAAWFMLEAPQPVEVTRYEWSTGWDTETYPDRNPEAWRLQASSDGVNWRDLDVVDNAFPITRNSTRAYVWEKGKARTITKAYSLVTRDGRRLVSSDVGGEPFYQLVPLAELPANLPPVREWKIYCLTASHTDIGLHHPQYVQRHGSVVRTDAARKLVAEDPYDADPAAYRYTLEGYWFFHNYPHEKGVAETRSLVANEMMRDRLGVSALCAGNILQAYGFEQMCRSAYTRKYFEERWGLAPKTMIMADNPGLSWSIVQPYREAGIENLVFLPNQWNPLPSTCIPYDRTKRGHVHNPDAQGGGARVDVRWDSPLPMLFWWEAADRDSKLLVLAGNHYTITAGDFGIPSFCGMESLMPAQLAKLEKRYPVDVWLTSFYCDDEWPNPRVSKLFRQWNAKWRWPEMHTVANPDTAFAALRQSKGVEQLQTLRGEMTSGWVQFLHSMPECLARKLAADRGLAATEAERCVAAMKGASYPAEDFRRAWWGLVMNDEHSYATPAGYQGRRVFETCMQHFEWVEKAEQTVARFANVKCETENMPNVKCKVGNGKCEENRWYRVTQKNGVVTSLYDKELGRELLNGAVEFRYTSDNHKTYAADPAKALDAEIIRTVRLDPNAKRVWVELEIKHARKLRCKSNERYQRYGYMAFPFDVPEGTFYAQLNGPVMRPYLDLTGHSTDSYVGAREWVGVENRDFGVAVVQLDSSLCEFGEIHPDKTCYTGRAPKGKSAIYPCLFNDWLVEHKPDGDSFNFRFRYAITSYKGSWQANHVPAFAARTVNPRLASVSDQYVKTDVPGVILCGLKAAEDGTGFIARFRETEGRTVTAQVQQQLVPGAKVARCTVLEKPWKGKTDVLELKPYQYATVRISNGKKIAFAKPTEDGFKYTGLITTPHATHGERLGQLYLEWGLDPSPDFKHWELYRSETPDFPRDAAHLVRTVTPERHKNLAFAVNRVDERNLKTHTRYYYAIRSVHKDGSKGPFYTFSGLTRDTPEGVITKEKQ